MTTARDGGSATIDMGDNFPSGRLMQAVMMPQVPVEAALGCWRRHPRVGWHGGFVMPQCSYTLMANRLRFLGCDPFRIACNRRYLGLVTA
jgi:hypothetical protein